MRQAAVGSGRGRERRVGLILLSQGGANVCGVTDQSHTQINSTHPSETGRGGADISVVSQSSEHGTMDVVWSALVVGIGTKEGLQVQHDKDKVLEFRRFLVCSGQQNVCVRWERAAGPSPINV